jgi:hypothetical protein
MELFIKEIGLMIKKKEMESNIILIILDMKVIFFFLYFIIFFHFISIYFFFKFYFLKGEFKGGHKSGFGKFYFKEEEKIYEGFYINDQRNGIGKIFHKKFN